MRAEVENEEAEKNENGEKVNEPLCSGRRR